MKPGELLWRWFWLDVARFAAARLRLCDPLPCGIPTVRDPNSRCGGYEPRSRDFGDWPCVGDGHYLCRECAHHIEEEAETCA